MSSRSTFWKTFAVLYGLGTFGIIAGLPYVFALLETFLSKSPTALPFPVPVLYVLQFLQSSIILAIAIWLGLVAARKIGCPTPIIESWLAGERVVKRLPSILGPSILVGIGVGIALLLLLVFVFMP